MNHVPKPDPVRLTINIKQAAEALGISPRLLARLTKEGRVPHVRLGRRVVYSVTELDCFLTELSAKGRRE